MCLCICDPRIFEFTPLDTARLSDIFYGLSPLVIMSNLNTWSFTLGGIYPNFLCPTHIFFIFFKNCETHFGICPTLPSPPSNTKHSVDLYYALTPMSCDVLVHYAIQSCHCSFIHATYMMSAICACLLLHNYPCIIWTFLSKSIQIPNISYNSCHHSNTRIH